MNNKNDKIVASFLMGECSEEELRMLNAWLNESEENRQQLFRPKNYIILEKAMLHGMKREHNRQPNIY